MDADSARSSSKPLTIYIDTDAYPVMQEIYSVGQRHALKGIRSV